MRRMILSSSSASTSQCHHRRQQMRTNDAATIPSVPQPGNDDHGEGATVACSGGRADGGDSCDQLLSSFASWDYSSSVRTTSSSTTTATGTTAAPSTADDNHDDDDEGMVLQNNGIGSSGTSRRGRCCTTAKTTSATPLAEEASEQLFSVSVSGVVFSLHPLTLARLDRLPWKEGDFAYSSSSSSQDDHNDSTLLYASSATASSAGAAVSNANCCNQQPILYHLHASSILFEMVLNCVLYGSLPNPLSSLSTADVEELEPLAILLDLPDLVHHLEQRHRHHHGLFRKRISRCIRRHPDPPHRRRHCQNRWHQQNHSLFTERISLPRKKKIAARPRTASSPTNTTTTNSSSATAPPPYHHHHRHHSSLWLSRNKINSTARNTTTTKKKKGSFSSWHGTSSSSPHLFRTFHLAVANRRHDNNKNKIPRTTTTACDTTELL
jgi:hypothetical protein